MAGPSRLHDRPFLDQQFAALPLYVTGSLPQYDPSVEFEARLPIHNAIGRCSVEILSGDLPAGGSVYVDNATSEIVVTWPAYTTYVADLANPGLETGDLTSYSYSTIGGNAVLAVTNDHSDAGSYSAHWPGGHGTGGEGGIEFVAVNDTIGNVKPGQVVSGSARAMYNPNGHVKGSQAQARLHWYDGANNFISDSKGFRIFGRQYNRKWTSTSVTGRAPEGAERVRMAVWGRARDGDVYFDSLAWDVPEAVGALGGEYCLELRVRDSGGRTADWSGCTSNVNVPTSCGLDFGGGTAFPVADVIEIDLGEATGTVNLRFAPGGLPDKALVIFDGETVIDTGYVGDVSEQAALDAELAAHGFPSEPITQRVGTGPDADADYAAGDWNEFSFEKTTATSKATVLVYGPQAGTLWRLSLTCPA